MGLHGPACNNEKGDERTVFAGKILYINGEPDGDPVSEEWRQKNEEQRKREAFNSTGLTATTTTDRIYQIGPYPPKTADDENDPVLRDLYNNHSLLVYHTVIEFLGKIYLPREEVIRQREGEDEDEDALAAIAAAEAFDPWKQLVEGNGRAPRDGESEPPPPRIPAVVYVAKNCVGYRQKAAKILAERFRDLAPETTGGGSSSFVHYGGACKVEGGIPVPPNTVAGGDWTNGARGELHSNYATIYTRYKYCLVLENTPDQPGYLTEKLMHALLGGCLPIYSGSVPDVSRIFREDAYIYWDPDDPEPALEEIRSLEADEDAYRHRVDRSRPLLRATGGTTTTTTTEATVEAVFSLIPGIGHGTLGRTLHEKMGLPVPESLRWPSPPQP